MKSESPLTPEQEAELHRRLAARDPVAPSQLAKHFLDPLAQHLVRAKGEADEPMCYDAATEALFNLSERPETCISGVSLWNYLCMSASRDLMNLRRKAKSKKGSAISLDSVELSSQDGKCLQTPDFRIEIETKEEADRVRRHLLPIVLQDLAEAEQQALELLIDRVKETSRYAEVLGITQLSLDEQEKIVKRLKDKLNARLKRARDEG
ncbi:MAG: hypothetical protein K2X38_20470 [Gemmataceae bacterium]|nr:hypothetical protein [Gemmataceae bacterium]